VLLGVTACVLLMKDHSQTHSLSLVFEKYGHTMDLDFNVKDVTFLWLTNSSEKTYVLPMTDGTNTFLQDTPLSHDTGSYLIRCEFSDPANPMPRVSFANFGLYHTLAPHSAVRLRVPLPAEGQTRRVAVLCAEMPSGTPRRFWTHGIGLSVLRKLPRSFGMKLLFRQPSVLRVWCDRDSSHTGEWLTE